MTVIRPNSISGINSITAKTNEAVSFYESDGSSGNVIAGVVTAANLVSNVTGNITGNVTGNLSGDIVGTRTLGTGVTVTSAGIVSATQYYGSGEKLTDIPGGNITGVIPEASLSNIDLSGLRKDIATLALQTAVDTNRAAYNLSDSFIDQFETDVGIAASTTAKRDSTEFVGSSAVVGTAFNFKTAGTHGQPSMFGLNSWSVNSTSSHSYGWTNDRVIRNNNQTSKYGAAGPKFAFDLRHDFEYYQRADTDSSGNVHNAGWQAYTAIISKKTASDGYVFGKNPTLNGSSIFKSMLNGDSENGNAGLYGYMPKSQVKTYVFTSAAEASIDVDSLSEINATGDSNTSINASTWSSAGGMMRHYYNSGSHSNAHGVLVKFDRSANQMELGFISNTTGSSFMSTAKTTITNVPSEGFLIIIGGDASGIANTRYYSMSVNNSGGAVGNGTISSESINATGSITSTTQTASSSRTKVSGVMLYKDNAGTATLGTDLKVSFSCDNGSNWTALDATSGNYTAGSDFSTGIKTAYLKEVTCTAGTQIKYKVEWANQSAGSKETQLHGMSVNY